MKIIGEKLSSQEMLQVKGGGTCLLCTCSDWSGQWYADYDDVTDSLDDLDLYCDGEGTCDDSQLCDRDQL